MGTRHEIWLSIESILVLPVHSSEKGGWDGRVMNLCVGNSHCQGSQRCARRIAVQVRGSYGDPKPKGRELRADGRWIFGWHRFTNVGIGPIGASERGVSDLRNGDRHGKGGCPAFCRNNWWLPARQVQLGPCLRYHRQPCVDWEASRSERLSTLRA